VTDKTCVGNKAVYSDRCRNTYYTLSVSLHYLVKSKRSKIAKL